MSDGWKAASAIVAFLVLCWMVFLLTAPTPVERPRFFVSYVILRGGLPYQTGYQMIEVDGDVQLDAMVNAVRVTSGCETNDVVVPLCITEVRR